MKIIENQFNTRIVARGSEISIEGESEEVSRVENLFHDLATYLKKNFELPEIKTRAVAKILGTLGTEKALVVDMADNDNLRKSAGNLANSRFLPPEGLNVYDILKCDQLVMTRRAVKAVQDRLEGMAGSKEV